MNGFTKKEIEYLHLMMRSNISGNGYDSNDKLDKSILEKLERMVKGN